MIISVKEDADSLDRTYDVFLVDSGDKLDKMEISYLFPIPKKYVERLPFQSIGLSLDHVKLNDDFLKRDFDFISELLKPGGISLDLDVVVN